MIVSILYFYHLLSSIDVLELWMFHRFTGMYNDTYYIEVMKAFSLGRLEIDTPALSGHQVYPDIP